MLGVSLKKSYESGNKEVRIDWQGNVFTAIAEAKCVKGMLPQDFAFACGDNWMQCLTRVNPRCIKQTCVDRSDGLETAKLEIKTPFPLWNRTMFTTKYPSSNPNPNEVILVNSGLHLEKIIKKHLTEDDKKNRVLGEVWLTAWKVTPVLDEKGTVTGSRVLFLNMIDMGAPIPEWVQNVVTSSGAADALEAFIKFAKHTSAKAKL